MRPGLFLSLEGIDGAGKSSHLDALEALLTDHGHQVLRTREPGGTPLAETLRELVLSKPMDPLTESLLVFAARRDHVTQVIEPALMRGATVLSDRFADATFAYQGAGRQFDGGILSTLEQWVLGGRAGQPTGTLLQPDLTLWFEVAPEVAAQRLADARDPDRFEAQQVEFFRRVSDGYAERARADPHRFERVDANHPRDIVWKQIMATVSSRGFLPRTA